MAPNAAGTATPNSSGMDPLTATTKMAKAIMSAPTGNGKLIATILSAYDLPDGSVPESVIMTYRESNGRNGYNEISTGPPAAKHKDHANSFKFGGPAQAAGDTNQLTISAPLSVLFESTVTFTLKYADPSKNLSSTCTIHKTLRVNDTQWLILNLDPVSSGSEGGSSRTPMTSSASRISATGSSMDQQPTLRLKLRLEGPYRPEVAAVINLMNGWFHAVDIVSDNTVGFVSDIPKNVPAVKLLLVPTVPLATVAIGGLPILGGILIIGIPFFLPIILIVLTVALSLGAIGSGVFFSTRGGRTRIQHVAEPSYQTFLMTKTGQRIIYDVGPRPSPQSLAHAVLPTDMIGKLIVSLIVDAIGSASYLIPLAGEGFDLTWAPISMILIGALYDDVMPNLKYVALIEELLPFTDFIPSATLGWVKEFAPNIIDEAKGRMGDTKRASRRERDALANLHLSSSRQ